MIDRDANERRAINGRVTLNQRAYFGGGQESALRDCLTDLIHLVGPEEFAAAVAMAEQHHQAETEGE